MRAHEHSLAALAAVAAAPLALGLMAARPAWRIDVRERLGAPMKVPPGAIWIHAASVGEILAASRLADRLRALGNQVFASSFTLSGREVMRRTRPEVPCQLAPFDHPWCVDAALRRVQPAALVLVETELWPSWIAAADRRGIPVILVSARVSDRSYPRYRRFGWIVGRTLRRLAAIGARTETDAERLRALGADPARISVTGDLKIDLDDERRPLSGELAAALGDAPVFVAGSTHPGEEAAVLSAYREALRAVADLTLILAPRHIDRAAELERMVREAGWAPRLRSQLGTTPLAPGEVLILDTVGELTPLYARAQVSFVGGSLVPIGGHNVAEPVFAGSPVLYGRYTDNVRHAAEILGECGAGRLVEEPAALGRAVTDVLSKPEDVRSAARRGREALLRHRGTSERTSALIRRVLDSTESNV
jgi:3-deoxy-D-manno-octulosonic-acid transferase